MKLMPCDGEDVDSSAFGEGETGQDFTLQKVKEVISSSPRKSTPTSRLLSTDHLLPEGGFDLCLDIQDEEKDDDECDGIGLRFKGRLTPSISSGRDTRGTSTSPPSVSSNKSSSSPSPSSSSVQKSRSSSGGGVGGEESSSSAVISVPRKTLKGKRNMGKKKAGYNINGTSIATLKDLLDFLKSHPMLQHCQLSDLGGSDGTGRLIWARNPGSVYWPAIIASLEDKPDAFQGFPNSGQDSEKEGLAPEDFRCVMFIETAFRIAVLQWKDIILVNEEKFEEQCELVYQLNINVIKRTWKREKPYKDAVDLLRQFMSIGVDDRQNHAFQLSLERKQVKLSEKSKPKKLEPKVQQEGGEEGSSERSVEVKERSTEVYSLRKIIPSDRESRSRLSVSSRTSGDASSDILATDRSEITPSPTASLESETASDISRKAKTRPKVGGSAMKEYVAMRFTSYDKTFKFSNNTTPFRCAECLEEVKPDQLTYCHDLPHHQSCLQVVLRSSKDGNDPTRILKCKCCAEQACFICKNVSNGVENTATKCCKCDLRYHRNCLLSWPQAIVQGSQGPITCPTHFCHTCVGEHYVFRKVRNVKAFSRDKYRCVQCPATYHKPHCLPAGCGEDISGKDFITCPKHTLPNIKITQRRFGCLTCGTNLKANSEKKVECSLCLQVFHPECVGYSEEHINNDISLETFGKDYKCSSCFWGLFPLYGQPVWFQQPNNKFWPARILFPRESSGRYEYCAVGRQLGQYSVMYFGPSPSYYDKCSRASPLSLATVKLFTTVKVYQEDNDKVKSAFDESGFYSTLLDEMRDKPEPFYKKIDKNIYRQYVSTSKKAREHLACCCGDIKDVNAVCTPNSGCHNRDTAIECDDDTCTAGARCQNRMFSQKKKDTENTEEFLTPGKGWAVKAAKFLKEGEFIVEYCGEIINNAEMQYRANRKTEEDPLYILEIDKHTFIDAEFCGNISRLINHSCEPNCRIEKYTSEGKPVVGVFAHRDIAKGEELTFDYSYGNNSSAPFRCHCGTSSCRGYVGKHVTKAELDAAEVVNPELERYDKECAKCCFGGHVLCCDYEGCFKVYHKYCAGLQREPQDEWFCPDHPVKPKAGKRRNPSGMRGPPTKKIKFTLNNKAN